MNFFLKHWKQYRIEILLFGLAFSIRFAYALGIQITFGSEGFTSFSDAEVYLRMAHNLVSAGAFSQMWVEPLAPDSLRTPLYPFFVSVWVFIKAPVLVIIFLQNILAGLIGILIFRVGKQLFSLSAGIIAALIMAIEPTSVYWNNLLMSDYLYSFLFLLAFYLFIQEKFKWFAVILGLAIMTRPIGLYSVPIFILVYTSSFFWPKFRKFLFPAQAQKNLSGSGKFFLKQSIIMVGLLFTVLVPWILRNQVVFGTTQLSSAGWFNLYEITMGKFAAEQGFVRPLPAVPPEYPVGEFYKYHFTNVPFYQENFIAFVKRYPAEYIVFSLKNLGRSLVVHDYEYLLNYVVAPKMPGLYGVAKIGFWIWQNFWVVWYGLALCFLASFRQKGWGWGMVMLALILQNNILLGSLVGGRFSLPILPFVLLLGSVGLELFKSALLSRKQKLYVRD